MVNLSFSFTTLIGFLDIIGSIGYLVLTINSISIGVRQSILIIFSQPSVKQIYNLE